MDAFKNFRILMVLVPLILMSISGCVGNEDKNSDIDHRQAMRDLVISISNYSHKIDPDFILIPQNGHDLLSIDPERTGPPAMDYINSIDGIGQEDLFYGFEEDNMETPSDESEWLRELLDLGKDNGLQVLVTDYCSNQNKMEDSYERNEEKGYISFAADKRELDNIPDHPRQPHNVNENDILNLSEARNFLYLLDTSGFDSRDEYLNGLRNTDFDLLIIDALFEDGPMLSMEEVNSLKVKKNGGKRLVISYVSIGEAEDYRYYWQDDWKVGNPQFIDEENPDWEGNYKVRYWDEQWQNVLFGETDSYLDQVLASGFDGFYMDIIEAFEYFE